MTEETRQTITPTYTIKTKFNVGLFC